MSNNKFILSVVSIAFAAITFTNIADSRADTAVITGAGNAFSNGALSSATNAMAVGATGPNPSVDTSSTTTSNGNTASAQNGGFATGGVPGRFVIGNGSADVSPAMANVSTFNTERTPRSVVGNPPPGSPATQQETATPSSAPAAAAGFGYTTSF
jgi:hypothetical protein